MIKITTFLILFILATPCSARDFIVQFEEENYRETSVSYSYAPVVYHSIQVSSDAGSKLLVLTGEDEYYRRWLRQYIAQGKAFIVKVPQEQTDKFVRASVFDIDVTRVHPFDLGLYKKGEEKSAQMKDLLPDINETGNSKNALSMNRRPLPVKDRPEKMQSDLNRDSQSARKAGLKKQADLQKEKAEQEKRKQALEKDKAAALEKQAQLQQLENERLLKALEDRKRIEDQRVREQETLFKALVEQRIQEEQQRRQELEQRYQELKQRLLQEEQIRSMELDARNREIELRWQELRTSLGL